MDLSDEIRALLPEARVVARGDGQLNDAEFAAFGEDRTPDLQGRADFALLVQPNTAEEIQALVRFARERHIALVPSGGRTGLAGGALAAAGEIVVSLARMNRLLEFLPALPALRVEAGMITADLQQAARDRGFYFPVDFAADGSSCVGGNIATNAGGVRVIRYGHMRRQVLGLKAVTGTGELLEFSGELLKNNTGYDLCQLLIGSEGTLGIVTEATLQLRPPPGEARPVFFALDDFDQVVGLLHAVHERGLAPLAFECLDRLCLETVVRQRDLPAPFAEAPAWSVLIEFESGTRNAGESGSPEEAMQEFLEEVLTAGRARDAVLAESSAARERLRAYREGISESLGAAARVHKYDVALAVAKMPVFLKEIDRLGAALSPAPDIAVFGHVGDGNLHLNILCPPALDATAFRERMAGLDDGVYELVQRHGGSISAEHGIGVLKKAHLFRSRSAAEIRLMRAIKASFDPDGILNPGKLLPDP